MKCNTQNKKRQYTNQGVKCSYYTTRDTGGLYIVLHTFYTERKKISTTTFVGRPQYAKKLRPFWNAAPLPSAVRSSATAQSINHTARRRTPTGITTGAPRTSMSAAVGNSSAGHFVLAPRSGTTSLPAWKTSGHRRPSVAVGTRTTQTRNPCIFLRFTGILPRKSFRQFVKKRIYGVAARRFRPEMPTIIPFSPTGSFRSGRT